MENQKVSEDYKKAYNQADMICTYMPHLLKGMNLPKDEPSEYTKGFQDRVKQYEKEQEAIKNFSVERLADKYKDDIDAPYKDKGTSKDIGRD
ncbi:hypothetical protein Q4Q35_10865 [Flavivirga aquimarina]|uniref:Uncharacterized protein n=1 Tax=Flavivirga aquimarina TaxID=2027862 RepID=A0ABT8WAY0_9FLAO|nr:hypothetical protein [Flavivirga aquimarina]MDO5970307.1 hypothetical protein [Flavivirga aquimarina]